MEHSWIHFPFIQQPTWNHFTLPLTTVLLIYLSASPGSCVFVWSFSDVYQDFPLSIHREGLLMHQSQSPARIPITTPKSLRPPHRSLLALSVLMCLAFMFGVIVSPVYADVNDIYISEVYEANGGTVKYVELYNPSAADIDLNDGSADVVLRRYSNAGTSPTSIDLTGVIPAGGFYVIGDSSVNGVFGAGTLDEINAQISHNGNDSYDLYDNSVGSVLDGFAPDNIGDSANFAVNVVAYRVATELPNDGSWGSNSQPSDGGDSASNFWRVFNVTSGNGNALTVASPGAGTGLEAPLTTGGSNGQPFPLSEGFDTDDCTSTGWQVISVDIDTANTWSCSAQYSNADVNGYGDSAPADEWLIAPALDMDVQDGETLSFRSYTQYTDVNYPQLEVLYATDYDGGGDPTTAAWTSLTGIIFSPEGSREWTDSGAIDLSGISGNRVYFAFRYTSSGTGGGSAANWRLDAVEFDAIDPNAPVEALIHEVQGSGPVAALADSNVIVEAIVVGDFQGSDQLRGFFIQEEDADADSDPNTSEGIFVFCGGCETDIAVGDSVRVVGLVEEFFNMSQIDVTEEGGSVSLLVGGNPLPTPATISLPVGASTSAETTFESVEGMLVTLADTMVVSEYFELARYGQLVLAKNERPRQFTDANEPDVAGYAAYLDALEAQRIILDDDNNFQNDATEPSGTPDEPYYWPRPGLSNGDRIRGGDTINNLTGVLHWSFAGQQGTDAWRVRPVEESYTYAFERANPRPITPDPVGSDFKVASFNVLNYFTTLDSRGANSVAELDRQREKIAAAICAIDADILGLIEIENNGTVALSDLLNGINGVNVLCGPYAAIDTGVIGTDEIAVAFIYKPATVGPVGDYAVLNSAVDPRFIDTKNRPALAQTFAAQDKGGVLTVVVNHLKSKGSSCNDVGDPDLGDGAANCNQTRADAAAAMVDWLATDPTSSGNGNVLIIGDLNAYRNETPIDNIELGADDSAGTGDDYTDLLDAFIGPAAYSYLFDGQLGYLDHSLASAGLVGRVTGVTVWHINADEPPIFDYNDEFQTGSERSFQRESSALPIYEPNAFRASDHDPVLVGIDICDDTTPPSLDITLSTDTLWPANHKYVDVTSTVVVNDNQDSSPTVTLTSVESNEPDNGLGDGDTADDIVVVDDVTFRLRAERSGSGGGRIYTITYTAVDVCGNESIVSETVTVPHSQGNANGKGKGKDSSVNASAAPGAEGDRIYLPSVQN